MNLWFDLNVALRYVNAAASAIFFIWFLRITVFHIIIKIRWMTLMFRMLTMVEFLCFYISVAAVVNHAPPTGTPLVALVLQYFVITLAKDALRFRKSMKDHDIDL